MKRGIKQALVAMFIVGLTGVMAGCGSSEKAGYVNAPKIHQESIKAQELQEKVEKRQEAVKERLEKVKAEKTEKEYMIEVQKSKQEIAAFSSAMSTEYRNAVEAATAQVAKEKKLTIVVDQGAMVEGGEDITEAVLDKMGRKSVGNEATKK